MNNYNEVKDYYDGLLMWAIEGCIKVKVITVQKLNHAI